jgi:nucleotide-binding universal stress UspA family protein
MEDQNEDLYLVPYDFTNVTEEAMRYALQLSHKGGGKVLLAHIVKNEDDILAAELKLEKVLKNLKDADEVKVSYKVMAGNIFEDLDKIGDLTKASVIVMGTHGVTGFQKLFGSNALKIVSSSKIPFIITQEDQEVRKIENIVLPFSFAKESVQVAQFAATLAEKYDATIHLVGYRDKDEWLLRDMKTNQAVVRRHLTSNKVKHDIITLPGKESYEIELMNYIKDSETDLIAAAYFSQGIKSIFHSFLQALITNEHKIPVITINAPDVMVASSGLSFIAG